jgi:hypothetical protein
LLFAFISLSIVIALHTIAIAVVVVLSHSFLQEISFDNCKSDNDRESNIEKKLQN